MAERAHTHTHIGLDINLMPQMPLILGFTVLNTHLYHFGPVSPSRYHSATHSIYFGANNTKYNARHTRTYFGYFGALFSNPFLTIELIRNNII